MRRMLADFFKGLIRVDPSHPRLSAFYLPFLCLSNYAQSASLFIGETATDESFLRAILALTSTHLYDA